MGKVEMKKVNSSTISMVGFDLGKKDDTCNLFVMFKNGKKYVYVEVLKEHYNNMMASESLGKYFSEHIKNKYECCKVEVEECKEN